MVGALRGQPQTTAIDHSLWFAMRGLSYESVPTGFGRQQNDHAIAERMAGATGKQQEIVDIC
jgi:hypothetical protein